jgi:hypothetical protein
MPAPNPCISNQQHDRSNAHPPVPTASQNVCRFDCTHRQPYIVSSGSGCYLISHRSAPQLTVVGNLPARWFAPLFPCSGVNRPQQRGTANLFEGKTNSRIIAYSPRMASAQR